MNEFNVLLAAATNGTPSGSLFDALFARYIAPQESWRELESPLPITILAAGEDLIDYRIFGNTVGGESVGVATESGEPAGYKLPMVATNGTATTTTPIYIGSNPLAEDEYVDFGEQKIYRMEGGTLTPTDPPVPIPALPTIRGETIIDYNPSTTPAVDPEKMYIKYKPLHTSATIYGFRINPDEPNSSTCVTYLADAVGMTPAAMGSTTFNYGSWADAFFMPKPCMLKFDGTVDYYLDPNDYSKKADGVTPSDYNNLAYSGNAMMEFPLIWYKYVPGVAKGEGYFYVSNHKVNDTYKCWSNMDCDGNIIEHFYMPIYNGCTYDGKMRSISGLTLAPWSTTEYSASATYAVGAKVNYDGKMWKCTTAVETAEAFDPDKWEQFAFNGNTTATDEIAQATACNTTAKTEWYIDTWNDRVLINGLLVLISKSIDTQGAFGRGRDSGSQAAKESYVTGSLDDKGLFYGSTANGTTAVKVFGMENWWSLVWHRTAGLIGGADNTYLYKMTASTADGSIADGYNTTGTGYPSVGGRPTTSNYVKKMQFGLFGFLPIAVGAYSTQYYKDYYYNGSGFALVGGGSNSGAGDGAFYVALNIGASDRAWVIAAALSCKPYKTLTANHNEEMIP